MHRSQSDDRELVPLRSSVGRPAPLGRAFFERPAAELARGLLGTILVRRAGGGNVRRARVVETEAYVGEHDLACHASKGRTPRTDVLFGPPGVAYVYFVYGMHHMFNVVSGPDGVAEAVLIRAAEPLDGWDADLTGPGKLARALGITMADNRGDLTGGGDLYFVPDPGHRPRVRRAKRIGVDYARHWKDRLLRFIDASSPVAAKLRA